MMIPSKQFASAVQRFRPRKWALWLTCSILVSIVLLGCAAPAPAVPTAAPPTTASQAPAATAPPGATTAAAATTAPAGKTLTVAVAALPVTVDPDFAPGQESVEIIWNTYEPLFKYKLIDGADGIKLSDTSGEGGMEGGLVESWTVSPDGKTYTLKIREGVTSAFGNELTAECVKWTFDREFGTQAVGAYIMGVANIPGPDSVKVVDDYTVEITLPAPNPTFLRVMNVHTNHPEDCIEVKKHATEQDPWATEWRKRNTAGFGPYTISEWTPGDKLVLTANPNWYGPPLKVTQIIYKEVPESANRLAMLLAGEVDLAENLTQRQLDQVKQSGTNKVVSVTTNQFVFVAMNANEGPTADPQVRQALLYATPYADIQNSVYFGNATQAYGAIPDNYPYFYGKDFWNYETDLDKAKQLLTEAGYPDGFETSILINADVPEQEEIAVLMRDSFDKIGVTLNIDKKPAAAYTDQKFSGAIQLNLDQSYALVLDVGYHMTTYLGAVTPLNVGKWTNAEFTDLLTQATGELDGDSRAEKLKRLQEIVITDAPHIFVAQVPTAYGMRQNVDGYVWYTHDQLRFDDLDIGQ
jgi:peptide/nickel transport system substrate-binding protein